MLLGAHGKKIAANDLMRHDATPINRYLLDTSLQFTSVGDITFDEGGR